MGVFCKDGHPDPLEGPVRSRPIPRVVRNVTVLAAAVLIGLAGCGGSEDPSEPETSAIDQESHPEDSQDDHAAEQGGDGDDNDAEEPEGAADDESDSAEDGVPGSEAGRALVFIHVLEPERLTDDEGEVRLPAADLAEILQDMGGVAEEPSAGVEPAACESDLLYVASADVRCTVTASFDGSEQEMTLYAQPIAAPGGGHGILYTADDPLTEDGRWAMFNGDNEATAIGMGGAYGMDPIPAEQLVGDMQTVIDFDFTHDSVDTSDWTFTVQDCPSELSFDQLAPVRCTATHDETGAEHVAWALPGSFYGQEPGLIVSIEMVPAGA